MDSFRFAGTSARALAALTIVTFALSGADTSLRAQTRPRDDSGKPEAPSRPYRGLFGSSANPNSNNSLTLGLQLYGGYDDNVLAEQVSGGSTADPRGPTQSGTLAGGDLALDYQRSGRRTDFGATVNTSARYFPNEDRLTSGSYGFGTGLSIRLSQRNALSLTQSAAYQPFYQLSLFPGVAPPELGAGAPSNLDYVVSRDSGWLYNGGVSFDRRLSQRSRLGLTYGYSRSDYELNQTTGAPNLNLNSQTGGFKYSRSVTQNFGFSLGYQYQRGTYDATRRAAAPLTPVTPAPTDPAVPPTPTTPAVGIAESHNIDIGIDYTKALTLSRRTQLTFSTGSSIVEVDNERHYRINGNAGLTHRISRSWMASVQYSRGLGLVGNFAQPIFSDNLGLGLSGLVGERLYLAFGGGLSTGNVGFSSTTDTSFVTYTGSASAQYAFTSNLASYVQYTYFNYDFPTDPTLPVSGRLERNGVRAGLSVTVPLLR